MCTAILLPAFFVLFGAERLLLAVADGLDAVVSNSEFYKLIANSIGTARSERHVVVLRTALIAMSGDYDFVTWVGRQEIHIRLESCSICRPHVESVIIKINVLYVLLEQFLIRRCRDSTGAGGAVTVTRAIS